MRLKILTIISAIMISLFCFNLNDNISIKCFAQVKYNYEYRYILIAEDDYLCVYKTSDLENPIRVINFDVDFLPEKDRIELREGILILDSEELRKRIEDFTG